jgi:hypothetical protein
MTYEDLSAVGRALERWYGCWARPWSYMPSFNRLHILLQRKDFFCVVLLLTNCERVAFAANWEGFNPSIDECIRGRGSIYRVTDGENLDVHCHGVALLITMKSHAEIGNLRTPDDFPIGAVF